jgi:hypothetical protein
MVIGFYPSKNYVRIAARKKKANFRNWLANEWIEKGQVGEKDRSLAFKAG